MKKGFRNKKAIVFCLSLCGLLIMTGCGSQENSAMSVSDSYDVSYEMATEEAMYDYGFVEGNTASTMGAKDQDFSENTTSYDGMTNNTTDGDISNTNQKLIKRYSLSLETLEYDNFTREMESLIDQMSGYIENLYENVGNYGNYGYNENLRYATYTIRIPALDLESFVKQVGDMANVVSKNLSVTDVTLTYVDLESKKEMYEIEQDNLMELLKKAETVEDMITIESRLTEIRYQLQSMESQLRTYDNLVDYATITIDISEVERLEAPQEASVGERIRTGFLNSMAELKSDLSNFGINFIIRLPRILWNLFVFALFVLAIFFVVKLIIRKIKKARMKKMQKNMYTKNPVSNVQTTEKKDSSVSDDTKRE